MMRDVELVLRTMDGDQDAFATLADRYEPLLHHVTGRYYLAGADRQDVRQEALIGLHKACVDFDCTGRASFATFAALCVERQVITALKASQRGKHRPLNEADSFTRPLAHQDEDAGTLADVIPATGPTVEEIVEQRHDLRLLIGRLPSELTDLQRTVLARRLNGATLEEAGDGLGKATNPAKTADNALCRIRSKARVILTVEAA